jgi:thioredoxin 1
MSTDVRRLRSAEWNSLISGKKLVAADFWAPWCPYCVRLKPIFDSVAKDYAENINFVKINVDEEPDLASRYGIQATTSDKVLL